MPDRYLWAILVYVDICKNVVCKHGHLVCMFIYKLNTSQYLLLWTNTEKFSYCFLGLLPCPLPLPCPPPSPVTLPHSPSLSPHPLPLPCHPTPSPPLSPHPIPLSSRVEFRASPEPDKHSTTELHPQPLLDTPLRNFFSGNFFLNVCYWPFKIKRLYKLIIDTKQS